MTPSSDKYDDVFKYIHDTGDNEFSMILRNYRLAKKYSRMPLSTSVTGTEQTGHNTTSVANSALYNDELLEQPLTNEEEKATPSVSAKKARPYEGLISPEMKQRRE